MECSECKRTFTRKGNYDRHVECHAKTFCCPICAKHFSCMGSMTRHRITLHRDGTQEATLKCRTCGKRFYRLDHFKRHAHLHKEQRQARRTTENVIFKGRTVARYVCPVCSKPFARAKEMERHKAGHPQVKEEPETPVDAAAVQKAIEDGWMIVREGVYSSDGLAVVHQFRLPYLDLEDMNFLDYEVSSAFLQLCEREGFMYHVDLTFTAVVDCGKLLVCDVDKPIFAERGSSSMLLSDMYSFQLAEWRWKDVFSFVEKHCDYGKLLAVPSARFHVKSIDGVPHVPYNRPTA